MGWFDRLEKIATGVGGAIQAPFGLVKDFAVAPWRDEEEFDGFFNTIKSRGVERGGQAISNLFGPKEGVGALVGGLSKNKIREPANKVFEKLEWTYREAIAEPLATLQYVNDQSGFLDKGGVANFLDPDLYRAGYARAQNTSVGQNLAYGAAGADLADDKARAEAEDKWFFSPLSGSADALLRGVADPTVIAGKAVTIARVAAVTKPIKSTTDFEQVVGTRRFARANDAMEGKTASELRDQFFPNDVNGATLSSALAEAGDAPTRARVLRLAMGDASELKRLYADRADIAGQMERSLDELQTLRSLDADNFAKVNRRSVPGAGLTDEDEGARAVLDTEAARLEAETERLYSLEERNLRNESVLGQIRNQPRYSRLDATRVAVTRSHTYQKSVLAAPVRTVFNMRPPRLLDLNNPAGDVAVTQSLRTVGMDKVEQDAWRTKYMAVASPEGRGAVAMEIEDIALQRMADEFGITRPELGRMMVTVNKGRKTAGDTLKSRAYDGEGRSRLKFKDDGTGELFEYPLLASQTANIIPLNDFAKLRKALTPVGEFKRRHPGTEIPEDLLTKFNQAWKPSVLLRLGWPIRVVMDEQMRIMGKIGVMATLANVGPGIANKVNNEVKRAAAIAGRGFDENGQRISAIEAAATAPQQKIGFGTMEVGEYQLPKVFGEDVNNPNAAFDYTASNPAFQRLIADPETQQVKELQKQTANYRSIMPDEPEHGPAWLNALNQQLGRDPLARVFLQGGDLEDGVAWLKTVEGRAHLRKLPLRRSNLEDFAGAVQDQVESYALGNPAIMQAALKQQVRSEDLFKLAPDAASRPPVHGGIVDEALGSGPAATFIGNAVSKVYTALGSVPSDTLSRHPFADHMYQAEARRLVGLLDTQAKKEGRSLSADDLAVVEKRSREYAISETQRLLYDLSEQSDLAHLLRFVSPFFSAWQETMTRWSGIAVENPAYAARLRMVWQSPEKAGIVTDENGNEIGPGMKEGQKITYPDGTVGTVGRERLITMKVPAYAKDILGMDGIRSQGQVVFNKKSFNMILQGNPGVGVPVQMPINVIVKDRPELADSVRFVLPFGPVQSTLDMIMPATAKRVATRAAGEEDDSYKNAALRIYFDKVTDYNLGKRDTQPTWAEATKDTDAFYNIRAVASFVAPAAPGFRSPYQPQIDAYRRLREENIETADQRFLDIYGQEFFALTASFTKSADGVAPTVEAFTARSKYKDLVEAAPELGAFIIGEEGAGEFSTAIYQSQKANKVKPGSTTNQRYALSFDEAAGQPNTKLGWMEYRRVADLIDVERVNRGLPNLQVKGARDLSEIKRQMIGKLAEKYPEWYEAFSTVDRNAMQKRLVGFRTIAYDDRMQGRPEMRGVRDYFTIRGAMKKELATRKEAGGSATLTSSANQDLQQVWDTLVARVVEQNLAFSDTYYRYLERDDLSAD